MSDNPLSTEATSSLINRAKGMIMSPAAEWPKVAAETKTPKEVLLGYALPLALISPICSVIGSFLSPINFGLPFYLATAIMGLVLQLASLFLVAYVANMLSPNFGGKNDYNSAFKLVVYSYTAAWLAGVFGLLGFAPMLALLLMFVAMIYGVYVFYLGTGPVMGIPQDKAIGYVVIYIVCALVAYVVVGWISGMIVGAMITPTMPNAITITYS